MSGATDFYLRYQWSIDEQRLEPEELQELNEIEEIARAISDTSEEPIQLYTSSSW